MHRNNSIEIVKKVTSLTSLQLNYFFYSLYSNYFYVYLRLWCLLWKTHRFTHTFFFTAYGVWSSIQVMGRPIVIICIVCTIVTIVCLAACLLHGFAVLHLLNFRLPVAIDWFGTRVFTLSTYTSHVSRTVMIH